MFLPKPGFSSANIYILLLITSLGSADSNNNTHYRETPSPETTEAVGTPDPDQLPADFPDDILETLHPGAGHGPPGENTNITGCGENQVNLLPGSAGILTSPNYPKVYDSGLDCIWNLQAVEGSKIIATFMDVRVKSPAVFGSTDALFVSLDGEWGNSQRFSGDLNGFTPFNLISEADKLAIRFKTSSNSVGSNGFRIGYFVIRNGDDDGLLQPAIDGYQIGCNVSPVNMPDLVNQCREGTKKSNFSDEATKSEFQKLQGLNRTNPNPFLVALALDDEYFCSGTLLSNHLVLTTAYCTKGVKKIELIMGTQDISVTDAGVQRRFENASSVLEHPYFDIDSGSHDISLIRLSEPIRFTKFVKAARLPEWRQLGQLFTGHKLGLSGWGSAKQEGGNVLSKSKTTQISITPNTGCKSTIFKGLNGLMMCSRNGFSTSNLCQADTGSPIHTRCNDYYRPPTGDDWTGDEDEDEEWEDEDEENEDEGDDGQEWEDEDDGDDGQEWEDEDDGNTDQEWEDEDEENEDEENEDEEDDGQEWEDEEEADEEDEDEADEEEENEENEEEEDQENEDEENENIVEDLDELLGNTGADEENLEPDSEFPDEVDDQDVNDEIDPNEEYSTENEEEYEEEDSETLDKLFFQNTSAPSLLSDRILISAGSTKTASDPLSYLLDSSKDKTCLKNVKSNYKSKPLRKTFQRDIQKHSQAKAISKYFRNDTDVRAKLRQTCPTCSVQKTPEDYCFLYYHFTLGKLRAKLQEDPGSVEYIKMSDIARVKKPKPQKPGKPKPQRPGKPKPQRPSKPKPQRPSKPKPQRPNKPKPQRPSKPQSKPQRPNKPKPQRPSKPKPQRPSKPKPAKPNKKPKPQRPGKPKPQKPGPGSRPNKPQRPTKRPQRPTKPKPLKPTKPKPQRPGKGKPKPGNNPQRPGSSKPHTKPQRPGKRPSKPKNPNNRIHSAKQCLNYGYSDLVLGMVSLGSCDQGFIYTRITAYLDFVNLNSHLI